MKKTWPVFFLVFTMFAMLTAIQGYYGLSALKETNSETSLIHEEYRKSAHALNQIQISILRSAVINREILVYATDVNVPVDLINELESLRRETNESLAVLNANIGTSSSDLYNSFAGEVANYWSFLDATDWKSIRSGARGKFLLVLKGEIVPKRKAILEMSEEVTGIARENLARETARINESINEAKLNMLSVMTLVILASVVATGFAVSHIRSLELGAEREHKNLMAAEDEMRRLSSELVKAGERKRKELSRELHDQVGQTLTGLKLGISGLERAGSPVSEEHRIKIGELKLMVEDLIKMVRHISMGLRPSILDDLGLCPALEWLAREFGRQSGLRIDVKWEKDLIMSGGEELRTDLYRIAQEALTNSARHSQASTVTISLGSSGEMLVMIIEDDGVGFEPDRVKKKGLGLVGIKERVSKYHGTLTVDSRIYVGTRITVRIPEKYGDPV